MQRETKNEDLKLGTADDSEKFLTLAMLEAAKPE